ncbi:hypothetical protein BC939DRAFT_459592 [Gamsiella multidivaricata]|uniref:uncharacterized protein n=1 Tax=Gamsiella multidivaricata TaxID=101098 RepID=UPI002220B038|nr:uncharacterized protein BC939DRAFT_459592 [Gamsiella multidivaricata]KAI7819727.1 hypothetical protein BC939DRAFT_459592 [Gamsiella multidivaricata]
MTLYQSLFYWKYSATHFADLFTILLFHLFSLPHSPQPSFLSFSFTLSAQAAAFVYSRHHNSTFSYLSFVILSPHRPSPVVRHPYTPSR